MKKLVALFFAVLVFSVVVSAQQLQSKEVIRPSVAFGDKWYGTAWVIGNIREDVPDNINLFPGVGYKTELWWLEILWWQHWSSLGTKSALDGRFGITHSKFLLYSELARFTVTGDVYTFVIVERPVSKKFRVGLETENFFRKKDSLGGGPRASYAWGTFLNGPVITSASYQVRPAEPDALRFQLTLTPRF